MGEDEGIRPCRKGGGAVKGLSVSVGEDVLAWLREEAAQEGRTLSAMGRRLIELSMRHRSGRRCGGDSSARDGRTAVEFLQK